MRTRYALLLLPWLAGACAETTEGLAGSQSDAEHVTRTVVHLNEDGTRSVMQHSVTVAEQRGELAANQQLEEHDLGQSQEMDGVPDPPVLDPGCPWYSLKLFDAPGYTGNYICFTGNGYVNLADYCRSVRCGGRLCICNGWNGAVRSYWSGNNTGWYIADTECPPADSMPFFEARSTVSSCIQSASYVVMNYHKL
jgi:hypothetical protein